MQRRVQTSQYQMHRFSKDMNDNSNQLHNARKLLSRGCVSYGKRVVQEKSYVAFETGRSMDRKLKLLQIQPLQLCDTSKKY